MEKFRFSILHLFVAFSVSALIIYVGCGLYYVFTDGVADAYASWGCGDLLVDCMKEHENQWPKSWGELEDFYNSDRSRTYIGFSSFKDLKRSVIINFDFDPAKFIDRVETNSQINANGVLRSGSVGGHEPNRIIREYLMQQR